MIESIGGNIKPGFPFTGAHRFNIPATIVDIDGDGVYEIAAGCDSGELYVLNHDGSQIGSVLWRERVCKRVMGEGRWEVGA